MDEAQARERLVDEAIDLVIRLQSDPENPVPAEMARAWRARSPDHEAVWTRVARIHGASGQVLTDQRQAARSEQVGRTRRTVVVGGLAALGALAIGSYAAPRLLLNARADHMTATGEIRRIELPDGSVATLGPDSALALEFGAELRRVELLAGMSYFDVAKDAARPFVVASGAMTATALGTAFDVSSDAGVVSLGVGHGLVEARAPAPALSAGRRLAAGDSLSFDPSSGAVETHKVTQDQVAAWRDRTIVAERETVSALVARIGRWIPGRIVVADPFVGSQRVSGIYDLRDPIRALQAVVHPAGAQVREISSMLIVVSPL